MKRSCARTQSALVVAYSCWEQISSCVRLLFIMVVSVPRGTQTLPCKGNPYGRFPRAPAGPVSHCSPFMPFCAKPVWPRGPATVEAAPAGPVSPFGPVTVEAAPAGPVSPFGPVTVQAAPAGPVILWIACAFQRASCLSLKVKSYCSFKVRDTADPSANAFRLLREAAQFN